MPFCVLCLCLFVYCLFACCLFAWCLFACWLFALCLFACCFFACWLFAWCLFALCLFACWLFTWCLFACCLFALCLFACCLLAWCLLLWCLFLCKTYMIVVFWYFFLFPFISSFFTNFDTVYFRFDLTLYTFRLLNFVIDIPSYFWAILKELSSLKRNSKQWTQNPLKNGSKYHSWDKERQFTLGKVPQRLISIDPCTYLTIYRYMWSLMKQTVNPVHLL